MIGLRPLLCSASEASWVPSVTFPFQCPLQLDSHNSLFPRFFVFFFFWPCGLQDLSSRTRDVIPVPGSESAEFWPLDHQGSPFFLVFQSQCHCHWLHPTWAPTRPHSCCQGDQWEKKSGHVVYYLEGLNYFARPLSSPCYIQKLISLSHPSLKPVLNSAKERPSQILPGFLLPLDLGTHSSLCPEYALSTISKSYIISKSSLSPPLWR